MLAHRDAGLAFNKGQNSQSDKITALDYYIDAALRGHATAPLNISTQFYSGEWVRQNYSNKYFR